MNAPLVCLVIGLVSSGSAGARERFACHMGALTSGERARHEELSRTLLAVVQEKSELRNGYAFRLPPSALMTAAEWVSFERKCCPFFAFELEQPKDQGPVWLRITGSDAVKAVIEEEFQVLKPDEGRRYTR
jgi:hypothetical protein